MKKISKVTSMIIGLVILLILLDQTIKLVIIINNPNKTIIQNFIEIKLTENTGGAFGVGQNSTFSYIVTNVIVLGIIIKFMTNGNKLIDMKTKIVLSLVLAGGISNLLDRIIRGFVVEFINIKNIPVFNLADLYITIGWIGFVVIFTIFTFKEKRNKSDKE